MLNKLQSVGGFILVLCVAAIAGGIAKEVTKKSLGNKQSSPAEVDAVVQRTVAELNAKGPVMLDEITRLDRVIGGPGLRFDYHHTLVKHRARDLDPARTDSALRSTIVPNVCGSKEMVATLKRDAIYVYHYRDSEGVHVTSIAVNRRDCGV